MTNHKIYCVETDDKARPTISGFQAAFIGAAGMFILGTAGVSIFGSRQPVDPMFEEFKPCQDPVMAARAARATVQAPPKRDI